MQTITSLELSHLLIQMPVQPSYFAGTVHDKQLIVLNPKIVDNLGDAYGCHGILPNGRSLRAVRSPDDANRREGAWFVHIH